MNAFFTYVPYLASAPEHQDVHEAGGSLLQEYWNLLTDPAHAMVELTYMLFGEILIFLIFAPIIKRYFNYRLDKAHQELDREHGIDHDAANQAESNDKD